MVGVLQADFYLRKLGGLGPTSIRPLVVAGLKASPPKLVLLQGSSEPTVIIGEAASVWSVASKILDEFVSWEAREGGEIESWRCGAWPDTCEFGIVRGVFEEGLPQRFRLVEGGVGGGVEVGSDFDNEAEVGRPGGKKVALNLEARGKRNGGDEEIDGGR